MLKKVLLSLVVVLSIAIALWNCGCIESKQKASFNTTKIYRIPVDDMWLSSPDISPDGNYVVCYRSLGDPRYENLTESIWIVSLDGKNKTLLYENESIDYSFSNPRFSPDGNMIVYGVGLLIKNGSVWDSNCTRVDSPAGSQPSFSPDGKKIVYSKAYGGIWVVDIDGTNKTQIWSDCGLEPCYSPDGSKIAFLRYSDRGYSELWIMNSDGSNARRILDDSYYADYPRYLPDGRIVWKNGLGIFVMNEDGSDIVLVSPASLPHIGGGDFNEHIGVSSDGTKIAFAHGIGASYICIVEDESGRWSDSDGDGVWDGIDIEPTVFNEEYKEYTRMGRAHSGMWIVLALVLLLLVFAGIFFMIKRHSGVRVVRCAFCGDKMRYIDNVGRWWCDRCGKYR